MKGRVKKLFCCFLAFATVFAMNPICPKAKLITQVTNIDQLEEAISNAGSGDTIILADRSVSNFIYSAGEICIDKSITIDLNGNGIVLDDCTIRIAAGAEVNIINNNKDGDGATISLPIRSTVSAGNIFTVENGATLNIRGAVNCGGTLRIEPLQAGAAGGSAGSINIYSGSYAYKSFSDKLFDLNDGKLTIYEGFFEEDPEPYMAADTECTTEDGDYIVRRPMSDNFKKILTNGKITLNAVKPDYDPSDSDEVIEAGEQISTMVNTMLQQYEDPNGNSYYCNPWHCDLDTNLFLIGLTDYSDTEYMSDEMHYVQIEFNGNVSPEVLSRVGVYAGRIPVNTYGTKEVCINDMEVINLLTTGFDPDNSVCMANMAKYSGQLRNIFENTNIHLKVHNSMAGATYEFCNMSAGEATISVDGTICSAIPWFQVLAKNIIYVPDDVALDEDALIAAAKNRIDAYLGTPNKVTISKGGLFTSYGDADLRDQILDEMGLTTAPQYYFNFNIDNKNYKFFIIPDSSKMVTPECKTVDIKTSVSIQTTASSIPLDASIRASRLTDGTEYTSIMDKLGVDENITYDLKLYSGLNDNYVTRVDDGEFVVSVPITDELSGEILSAYYVDAAGNIEEHPVEVVNNVAKFETNHFSVYTIAKSTTNVCSVNGKAHRLTQVAAKAATTTAEGNKAYWICDCGKWFSDADGKQEITDKSSVIIAKLKQETKVEPKDDDKNDVSQKSDKQPNTGDEAWMTFVLALLCGAGIVISGKNIKENRQNFK